MTIICCLMGKRGQKIPVTERKTAGDRAGRTGDLILKQKGAKGAEV